MPMPESIKHPLLISQAMPRGTVGTPIELVANFYKFDFSDHVICHYDVCITKDKDAMAAQGKEIDVLNYDFG